MIHLCTMIGENTLLLNEFITHYKNLGVDRFHFIVHDPSEEQYFTKDVKDILALYHIGVEEVYSGKWNGAICTKLINSVMKKYPEEWFVIADLDEFQIYPQNLKTIISEQEKKKKDFVTGLLLDRFSQSGHLTSVKRNLSIWSQFPMCGFFSFPLTRSNPYKITLSKGKLTLSEGQHGVIFFNEKYPQTNEIIAEVHHFKWNDILLGKIKNRLTYERRGDWINSYQGYKGELECILEYFGTHYKTDLTNPLFMFAREKEDHSYANFNSIKRLAADWDVLHAYPTLDQNIFEATIIISSYNQGDIIQKSVKELIQQATQSDKKIQIVIADDGSTLSEQEKCTALTQYSTDNIKIQFVTQEDKGFRLAASRNNAIKLAQSNVLIFIDGDCFPMPGFLNEHINFHKKNSYALCVGSRGYAPLEALKQKSLQSDKNYELMEAMESYTVNEKANSQYPWRAVLGRNFSVKSYFPLPLFDENIKGWGFEDTAYALDLFFMGYQKVVFSGNARVVQFDDFSSTNDPFKSLNNDKIAATQKNALYLMSKYKRYDDIFMELGAYLSFFAEPFDYNNGVFILNEEKCQRVHKLFSDGKRKSKQEYVDLFNSCRKKLIDFYKRRSLKTQKICTNHQPYHQTFQKVRE